MAAVSVKEKKIYLDGSGEVIIDITWEIDFSQTNLGWDKIITYDTKIIGYRSEATDIKTIFTAQRNSIISAIDDLETLFGGYENPLPIMRRTYSLLDRLFKVINEQDEEL